METWSPNLNSHNYISLFIYSWPSEIGGFVSVLILSNALKILQRLSVSQIGQNNLCTCRVDKH